MEKNQEELLKTLSEKYSEAAGYNLTEREWRLNPPSFNLERAFERLGVMEEAVDSGITRTEFEDMERIAGTTDFGVQPSYLVNIAEIGLNILNKEFELFNDEGYVDLEDDGVYNLEGERLEELQQKLRVPLSSESIELINALYDWNYSQYFYHEGRVDRTGTELVRGFLEEVRENIKQLYS